jgi:uncharacterized lipoprotein YajG
MGIKLISTISLISSLMVFTGCATVQEAVKVVATDPNTHQAAVSLGSAAAQAVAMSNPELAAIVTSGIAVVSAVTALAKAYKKVKK